MGRKFQLKYNPNEKIDISIESEDPKLIEKTYEFLRKNYREKFGGDIRLNDGGGYIPYSTLLLYCYPEKT
ncbi:MAG: hypothetical protein GTN38_00575 [Candidatus Aenigmarchaeota archaeon]|nr:hypothetical protein [Candidatus Aenigmarchaeota archaeon]NIP40079.1 hypothetical protein [Candidatus Aenigmarchaeota archaeon]NIQ18156.1 hypothetical protein [Candidatus Aenigmarchaeota archaeon]